MEIIDVISLYPVKDEDVFRKLMKTLLKNNYFFGAHSYVEGNLYPEFIIEKHVNDTVYLDDRYTDLPRKYATLFLLMGVNIGEGSGVIDTIEVDGTIYFDIFSCYSYSTLFTLRFFIDFINDNEGHYVRSPAGKLLSIRDLEKAFIERDVSWY